LEFTVNDYQAPQRDMKFVMNELLDYPAHYAALPNCEDASIEIVDAIREEGAKFSTNVLAPINKVGDQEGCTWIEGEVTTPTGFKEAYNQFKEAGWPGLIQEEKYGGQGLPFSVGLMFNEMISSANLAWSMLNGANNGTVETIDVWGTPEQKNIYLTKIISGDWSGTMCLTESHCGTDLGMLRTKAEPNSDGSYNITGTKIFITQGEHDLSENIVHIVLARMPNAPAGVKGISLFIVPKFVVNADGTLGERNALECGSLEHKMGIHGNATCVMNFDGAKAWLIGPENKGLNCMFTFMNVARIGTALQGVTASEGSFQGALAYAKDRLAMRSLTGVKAPEKAADPIIVHPDVRKMLLTQKAFAEGGRALVYLTAMNADIVHNGETEEARKAADDMLGFLTPIAKAFLTETGLEAANHGVQVFGGHGFIAEWGMEQIVRDTRISTLYEGTTGIQALDLLGRKVLMTQGASLKQFTKLIHAFCKENADDANMKEFVEPLVKLNKEWGDLTMKIGMTSMQNRDEVGSASVDYLMYSGYATLALLWAQMAKVAQTNLAAGTTEEDFYGAKVKTARFYFQRILPRTATHALSMVAGADSLMDLDAEHFAF
jgi:alkylation response protein AidB-like acyl-CoA dehydrogenase